MIRRSSARLILPLLLAVPAPAVALDLEEAMAVAGMTPSGVGLRADSMNQPGTLSAVKRLLSNPWDHFPEMQDWAENVLQSQTDTAKTITWMASLNDVAPASVPLSMSTEVFTAWPESIPDWLQESLREFLIEADADQEAWRREKDLLNDEERSRLSELLWDEEEEDKALSGEPSEPIVQRRIGRIRLLEKTSRETSFAEALRVARAVERLKTRVLEHEADFPSLSTQRFETPRGWITVGGWADDAHFSEPGDLLVLDVGGNDAYQGSVAAGADGRSSVVLDLSGDDFYSSTGSYALGSGRWGVGFLEDLEGDDVYKGAKCSQGCGAFGAGILIDRAGNDIYNAESQSQGAGFWGLGLLSDQEGEDAYRLDWMGQGFSGIGGIGLLLEGRGNDQYFAGLTKSDPREPGVFQSMAQGFSLGLRDYAAGGAGALVDGAGHDHYKADYFGQGSSYWFALGLLYDRQGRDTYVSRRYTQGAGVHSSVGFLLDVADDDTYLAWGGAQGMGWDYAVGLLMDESGDDIFSADWGSQGMGGANGWGVFVDNGGSDLYYSKAAHGQGFGDWDGRRYAPSFGLFADTAGEDRYPEEGREGGVWSVDRWGVGVDASTGPLSGLSLRTDLPFRAEDLAGGQEQEERKNLQTRLSRVEKVKDPFLKAAELLDIAGYWGLDEATPQKARRMILRMPHDDILPGLLKALDCRQTMGYLLLEEIFLRYGPKSVEALTAKAGSPPEPVTDAALREQRLGLFYLGQTASPLTTDLFLRRLSDPSWRIRSAAARALGDIYDMQLRKKFVKLAELLRAPDRPKGRKALADWLAAVPYKDRLRIVFALQPLPWKTFEKLMEEKLDARDPKKDEAWAAYLYRRKKDVLVLAEARGQDLPPQDAVEALQKLLSDPDESVRHAAAI
ncbi:MAG: HEAT repeat domain-containing protein, partial [Elusimicrobia bacterium]|nr:HEAT repeat domain-containing protein [Elusimicrobiota bacterium]